MREKDARGSSHFRETENREWLESLDYVYQSQGAERVRDLLWHLHVRAHKYGVKPHFTANQFRGHNTDILT